MDGHRRGRKSSSRSWWRGCRASHDRAAQHARRQLDEAGGARPEPARGLDRGARAHPSGAQRRLPYPDARRGARTARRSSSTRADARNEPGAIEAGAGPARRRRCATTSRRSIAELEAAWTAMTPVAWDGHGLSRGRPWPCRACPTSAGARSRSITSTWARGTAPPDWPEDYVAARTAAHPGHGPRPPGRRHRAAPAPGMAHGARSVTGRARPRPLGVAPGELLQGHLRLRRRVSAPDARAVSARA